MAPSLQPFFFIPPDPAVHVRGICCDQGAPRRTQRWTLLPSQRTPLLVFQIKLRPAEDPCFYFSREHKSKATNKFYFLSSGYVLELANDKVRTLASGHRAAVTGPRVPSPKTLGSG
jgi:hypothetical protein